MLSAVLAHTKKTDAVIMAAAVADYKPANPAKHKIKKHSSSKTMELLLEATTDILAILGKKKRSMTLVGFALETKDELAGAKEKLRKKNLDLIVLNSFGKQNRVFGSNLNTVAMIDKRGKVEQLPIMPKFDIANKILNKIKTLL